MSTKRTLSDKAENSDDYFARLEAVLNTVIDGIITINHQGIIQSFNPSAERIFGYKPKEVIGKNVKILMPEPYHSEHDGYLKNFNETGQKKVIGIGREVAARRKDGSIFPMELGVNEMKISGETMFVGTIRDISDRKKAEQAIKDSEAKLQAIVDNTVDGMITIGGDGCIETFNKACEKIFGYRAEEVVGKNVKVLMPEPYHSEHDTYLENYDKTKEKKIIGIGREVKGKRKDGQVFPLDLSVSEVNVQGRKLYSGIVRDISERKDAEEKLYQANAELEEFAYRTSHDLRSPLVSSLGLLNYTERFINENKSGQALETIGQVQKSLKKLEVLVQDILALTRMKNAEEVEESLDVGKLVDDALENLSYMDNFGRLDIQKDLKFNENLITKKSRLTLILENLISNAIKYQDLSKKDSFVRIITEQSGNDFVLAVKDNGLGVPDDQKANLFAMFKRFHPKTAFGSGLGLYMIKKSAEVLGGRIHYQDEGEGSCFILSLPLSNTRNEDVGIG